MNIPQTILRYYGLQPEQFSIEPFGSGLINHTWKVAGQKDAYVLQRVNKQIFKNPEVIADNLHQLDIFLKAISPDYLFVAPIPASDGRLMMADNGEYYRLFPFIKGSHTVNSLSTPNQAYEAARQFGKFTRLLNNYELSGLSYPLKDFHNLELRLQQFNKALYHADKARKADAMPQIIRVLELADISSVYETIIHENAIPLRVIHHDTKINNVLFDQYGNGLCVIDLDTVMPGYFISDVGDMMRTYLAEADEEETNLDNIRVREDFFAAIYKGYMEQLGDVLTEKERSLFIYAGKFMIYMQAIRFLTDHLNEDIYYPTHYPGHNLMRAKNQLRLLDDYLAHEPAFEAIMARS